MVKPSIGKYQRPQMQSKKHWLRLHLVLLGLRQLISSHFTVAQVLRKHFHGLPSPICHSKTLVVLKMELGG